MFRHIVIFTIKGDQEEVKKNSLYVKEVLDSLKEKIPFIKDISTGIDFRQESNTLCLDVLLNKQEELEKYAAHPEHLKVAALIKPYLEGRSAVDYNI